MATAPLPSFKVVKQPANGTKIAGKRRVLNAVFQAPEPQVRFQVLDGLLAPCNPDGSPIAPSAGGGQADFSDPANSGLAPAVA